MRLLSHTLPFPHLFPNTGTILCPIGRTHPERMRPAAVHWHDI